MSPDSINVDIFVKRYNSLGSDKFYKFLLKHAIEQMVNLSEKDKSPDLTLLEYCDFFIKLYRREGEEIYFLLAKDFRRAAHKIYRIMEKKGAKVNNTKFIRIVKK